MVVECLSGVEPCQFVVLHIVECGCRFVQTDNIIYPEADGAWVEGLAEEFRRSHVETFVFVLSVLAFDGGNDWYGVELRVVFEYAEHFKSAHARHVDVEYDGREFLVVLTDELESCHTVGSGEQEEAVAEQVSQCVDDLSLVVDDEQLALAFYADRIWKWLLHIQLFFSFLSLHYWLCRALKGS